MSELSLSISFNAVRIRIHSRFTYEQAVERLLEQLGGKPVNLEQIATQNPTWESYLGAVKKEVGPGGFMLLGLMDHGAWVSKTGLSSKALRVTFGNPLIAISMLKHDLTAGLFVPVECLVQAERDDGSSITYIQPSSVIARDHSSDLFEAARVLDHKVEKLLEDVSHRGRGQSD